MTAPMMDRERVVWMSVYRGELEQVEETMTTLDLTLVADQSHIDREHYAVVQLAPLNQLPEEP